MGMSPECLTGEAFQACLTRRRPQGRPRTYWRDYISQLALEGLGAPQGELEDVVGERSVWDSLLRLLAL